MSLTPWADKPTARAQWADAVAIDDTVLDDLLEVATYECSIFAPPMHDRDVDDAVTTTDSVSVTSASGEFRRTDVGRSIAGTGIPASTVIAYVLSAEEVVLSAAATATSTTDAPVTLTVSGLPKAYVRACVMQAREVWDATMRDSQDVIGVGDYAIRARPLTGAVKQLLRPRTGGFGVMG